MPASVPENMVTSDPGGGHEHPIVALHGFTQTGRSWSPIAKLFATEFFAPGLPGHGEASEERPATLVDAAELVLRRVTADLGGRPAWWIGYSLGGRVLLHLALRHPDLVAGLVLVSTTAGIDDAEERKRRVIADTALADEIERDGAAPFIDRWLTQPLFVTLTTTDADRADRRRNSAAGLAASLRSCGTGTQLPLWDRLPELRVPSVIVTGTLDTKFTQIGERLQVTLPRAVHHRLDGAGHACHLEQPQRFVDAVREGRRRLTA